MKVNIHSLLLCIILFTACVGTTEDQKEKIARENPNSQNIKFTNGKWFNGSEFENKTVWVSNGILQFEENNIKQDTTINLNGNYIIPPFAEAHNHNLESDYKLNERINSYLENGVFYVKHLSSIKKRLEPLMHHYNKPTGVDASFAHAPLTATGGHPIALRKKFLEYGRFDGLFETLEDIESHGYFIIDDEIQLDQKWEQIRSFKPDFIKLMLLHSEEYEKRKNDTIYFGNKGLNPDLVPLIVAKAHKTGLRVSAHVATAYDFHVAVNAKVDEIAHLPEIRNGKEISKKDVKMAKKNGTIVITTTSLLMKNSEDDNYGVLRENMKSNLKLLKDNDVTIAIGSDMYNDNSVEEFNFLYELDVFSNLELLKMWCENSATTIFPDRKIGYLRDGYEASFLVLNKNPLVEIKGVNKAILLKIKQGNILK